MADKICYSFLLCDDSCHTYRSDDFGTTWVDQQTLPEVLGGEFLDYAMATQDEDYNTQVTFFNNYLGDFHHYAGGISPDGRSSTWTVIDPSNFPGMGITQEFVTGAISAGGQTILAPVFGTTDLTASYPRISDDFGMTWRDITDFGTGRSWGPCCFAANKAKMYMTWEDGGGGGIAVSSDGGNTWSDLPNVPPASINFGGSSLVSAQRLRSSLDGSAIIYADDQANVIFSLDFGDTWTIVNDPINLTTLLPFIVYSSTYADCALSGDGKIMLVSFAVVSVDTYPYQSVLFGSRDSGATWTQLSPPSILDPVAALLLDCNISNDGRAVVCAFQDADTFNYRVDMSLDSGVTWKSVDQTPQRVEIADYWTTVFAFPNNQPEPKTSLFIASASDASGPATNIMSSEDGSSWALQTTPTGSGNIVFNSVIYSQSLGLFCAVGNTNGTDQTCVMTSPDGETWTFRDLPNILSLTSVTWSEVLGIFIAVGSGSDGSQFGYVFTSTDGIVWTKQTCPVGKWVNVHTDPLSSVGTFIVAVSSDFNGTSFPYSVMHSEDGVTWTGAAGLASSSSAGGWAAVVYAGWAASSDNRFVAVGGDSASAATTGAIMYSGNNNPDSWTLATHPAHTACLGVNYDQTHDRTVAVGPYNASAPTKSGALYSDHHGQTWSTYTPIEGNWTSLIWAPDLEMFVAVGAANGTSTNIVMTSPDGIAWTAQVTDATINAKSFSGVAYRLASPTGDACILVPPITPKGGYIIERLDNRIWPTVENAWCVDCGFTLARPTPNADLQIQPVP